MNKKKFIRYKAEEGFTVLEVVLVMSISLILITVIGLSMFSSFNAYSAGDDLIQVQQNVRTVIRYLTNELRNVNEIKLYNSIPESLGSYNYIYLENNSFKMKNYLKEKTLYTGNISSLNYHIIPINEENSKYNFYLQFSITGSQGNSTYQISSTKILLNNLETNTSDNNNGIVIAYKNPN